VRLEAFTQWALSCLVLKDGCERQEETGMKKALPFLLMGFSMLFVTPLQAKPLDGITGLFKGDLELPNGRILKIEAKVVERPNQELTGSLQVDSAGCSLKGDKEGPGGVMIGSIRYDDRDYLVMSSVMDGAMHVLLQRRDNSEEDPFYAKLEREWEDSPLAGKPAPEGAVVLFDGSGHDEWEMLPGTVSGGLRVGGNTLRSKQEFGDALIHVEFRTPFMPYNEGQARGNSGVYVHGRYEIQVLDSFGDPPADNLCGGIYQIAKPKVQACLPPELWQTYDITFRAPRFDASGNKTEDATVTVLLNGVLIHDQLKLPHATPGGISSSEAEKGPLLLQNHDCDVRYRNIWIKPLN
jgi:hypothetical protein